MNKVFYCGYCFGHNIEEIETYEGEDVEPENPYDDTDTRGIVVKCLDCQQITGFLVLPVGVVKKE